ncbi:MAG: GAF domain-containing protein, partial [Planctomycetaceae bacterium]
HDTTYGQRPVEEISTYNQVGLDIVKQHLLGTGLFSPEWSRPGQTLAQAGVQIEEATEAAWLFQDIIHPFVSRSFSLRHAELQDALTKIDGCVREFVMHVLKNYALETRREVERQQQRTELVLEMTRQVSRTLELEDVLRRVAVGIATSVGAHHCIIYLLNEEGNSGTLWATTTGFPAPVIERIESSPRAPILLSETHFAMAVLEKKQPVVCHDAQVDAGVAGTAGRAWGTRAMLGVPCIFRDRVLAVAIVVTFDEPREFDDEQVALAQGIANAVAPAIENARLYGQVEQMAALEERTQLAREIHDELAQTLGAIKFRASLTTDFLDSGRWTEVRQGMMAVRDMADAAYTQVREEIFNLRSITSLGAGGFQALQAYLDNYQSQYGLDVRLEADEEAVAALGGNTGVQVIRIIQEALNNVRKHGQTSQARLRIQRQGSEVLVEIEDRGQGFQPAGVPGEENQHFGLQFMHERAAKVGGTLVVESRPGQGTKVALQVPYTHKGGIL